MLAIRPAAHRLISVRRHGSVRTLVILAPEDRRTYSALAASAAPGVEAALSERVVANRVAVSSEDPSAFALRPWRVERRAFARALRELAETHRALVFADVARCYPSIQPVLVRDALRGLGCPGGEDVERFLARLQREGILGLPVGPEPSALFANAVLHVVDAAVETAGISYLRWVDDLVLGVDDPADAERALDTVRGALARLGLRTNERKTRIVVDPGALVAEPSGHHGGPVRVG